MDFFNSDTLKKDECLFRYDTVFFIDQGPTIHLTKYKILSTTPKGFWIPKQEYDPTAAYGKRWVSNNARKRFVYPTMREALYAYIKRKEKMEKILRARLKDTKTVLKIAIELLVELN